LIKLDFERIKAPVLPPLHVFLLLMGSLSESRWKNSTTRKVTPMFSLTLGKHTTRGFSLPLRFASFALLWWPFCERVENAKIYLVNYGPKFSTNTQQPISYHTITRQVDKYDMREGALDDSQRTR
jgi:hypothetical protein